jgi:hypothetical protein
MRTTDNGYPEPQPSTLILMLLNFFGWCVIIGLFFGAYSYYHIFQLLLIAVLISTLGQIVVHYSIRRKHLIPWIRILLFAMPSLLMLLYYGPMYVRNMELRERDRRESCVTNPCALSGTNYR